MELYDYARLFMMMQVISLGYVYQRLKALFSACCIFFLVISFLLSMMKINKTKIQFIQSMRKNYNMHQTMLSTFHKDNQEKLLASS